MAKGINKVILIGNLGADPEIRYTQGGSAVANISVATSEVWRDKQTGDQKEKTEWHRVVFFARLAEVVGEYLVKGSKVYVEGRIETNKWQDQEGQDRYTTQIIGREMQMLDSRGGQQGNTGGAPAAGASGAANYRRASQGAATSAPLPLTDDLDDDIPF